MRAQFIASRFENIPPPPSFDGSKLKIMYVGRISEPKGVFDILEMAKTVNALAPNQVEWEVCGLGPDFEELKQRRSEMGLEGNVSLLGRVSPEQQRAIYAQKSHLDRADPKRVPGRPRHDGG